MAARDAPRLIRHANPLTHLILLDPVYAKYVQRERHVKIVTEAFSLCGDRSVLAV
jgi:hypothetical protein